MTARRLLIIDAHPRAGSLCEALATAAAEGARASGAAVRRLTLRELKFDLSLRQGYASPQPLEPDLREAQAAIAEADHLTLVYPTWWGTYPALLKGFLDRVLLPGFAFKYHAGSAGWHRLLAGRSARLVVTLDWPRLAHRWYLGAPGHRAMSRATLTFCGIAPVAITELNGVRQSTAARRAAWLAEVRRASERDGRRRGRAKRAIAGAAAEPPPAEPVS